MFAYLSGNLVMKEPTAVVVDVHGVGYWINVPLSTYEVLPPVNHPVKLLIYFHVREDIQALYGFATAEEKELFLMLINISGIGPKMALTILSGASPSQFKTRIRAGDEKALTLIPGIGPKTARRIILELGEKLGAVQEQPMSLSQSAPLREKGEETLKALLSLGYRRQEAIQAIQKAIQELGEEATLEQYIKTALNKM